MEKENETSQTITITNENCKDKRNWYRSNIEGKEREGKSI